LGRDSAHASAIDAISEPGTSIDPHVDNASQILTHDPLRCHLAALHNHLHDRCDGSVWLVQFDVVAALIGNQLLAMR